MSNKVSLKLIKWYELCMLAKKETKLVNYLESNKNTWTQQIFNIGVISSNKVTGSYLWLFAKW